MTLHDICLLIQTTSLHNSLYELGGGHLLDYTTFVLQHSALQKSCFWPNKKYANLTVGSIGI